MGYMHIPVLNGVLWDMDQGHSGICELGQFGNNQNLRQKRLVSFKMTDEILNTSNAETKWRPFIR